MLLTEKGETTKAWVGRLINQLRHETSFQLENERSALSLPSTFLSVICCFNVELSENLPVKVFSANSVVSSLIENLFSRHKNEKRRQSTWCSSCRSQFIRIVLFNQRRKGREKRCVSNNISIYIMWECENHFTSPQHPKKRQKQFVIAKIIFFFFSSFSLSPFVNFTFHAPPETDWRART